MGRTLASLSVILLVGFTACRNDYTCRCVPANNKYFDNKFTNVSKRDARDLCIAAEETYKPGHPNGIECYLMED